MKFGLFILFYIVATILNYIETFIHTDEYNSIQLSFHMISIIMSLFIMGFMIVYLQIKYIYKYELRYSKKLIISLMSITSISVITNIVACFIREYDSLSFDKELIISLITMIFYILSIIILFYDANLNEE